MYHTLQIHEFGSIGSPAGPIFANGALGNILADANGIANVSLEVEGLSLSGSASIIGRPVSVCLSR
jgi:hypothetical protein